MNDQIWLQVPDYLRNPEDCWPHKLDMTTFQLPLELLFASSQMASTSLTQIENSSMDRLLSRYSTFFSLLKGTSWLICYKSFLLSKVRKTSLRKFNRFLAVEELIVAENNFIGYIQRHHFGFLIKKLDSGRILKKGEFPRYMLKFQPVLNDGILMVGGKLANAPVEWEVKHPIIIPDSLPFTTLLILKHHIEVRHSGMSHTWTSLRQRYWVVNGASTVRLLCKRRNTSPGQQVMADLPEARFGANLPPFSNVGVDYFGPFFVKRGWSKVKRYECIFLCLTIRAVHIEVVSDLSTNIFINVLRRFIARRGCPLNVFSDNGTNFVGEERILKEALKAWNNNQIENYLKQRGIIWTFNLPAASHMGGSWERQIRSIRQILTTVLHSQLVSDDKLSTLLTEVEDVLNSRSLVPMSLIPKAMSL